MLLCTIVSFQSHFLCPNRLLQYIFLICCLFYFSVILHSPLSITSLPLCKIILFILIREISTSSIFCTCFPLILLWLICFYHFLFLQTSLFHIFLFFISSFFPRKKWLISQPEHHNSLLIFPIFHCKNQYCMWFYVHFLDICTYNQRFLKQMFMINRIFSKPMLIKLSQFPFISGSPNGLVIFFIWVVLFLPICLCQNSRTNIIFFLDYIQSECCTVFPKVIPFLLSLIPGL